MTAIDATNLGVTFTVPISGRVLATISGSFYSNSGSGNTLGATGTINAGWIDDSGTVKVTSAFGSALPAAAIGAHVAVSAVRDVDLARDRLGLHGSAPALAHWAGA